MKTGIAATHCIILENEDVWEYNYLSLLPIVEGRKWSVDSFDRIRDVRGFCPLCALIDETLAPCHPTRYRDALTRENLPITRAALLIATAADDPTHRLRGILETILGVAPVPSQEPGFPEYEWGVQ